jgi:ribosomal protein S12 methylthiotransferase
MNIFWVSLGCAKNQADSEWMMAECLRKGWHITDGPEHADVIVVNTCGFIEAAVNESIDTILALVKWRKTGPCKSLIVIGCLVERYREKLQASLPEVDLFVGTAGFDRIVFLIEFAGDFRGCYLPSLERIDVCLPAPPRRLSAPGFAYIKIAEGCDRHCTYCIIPRLRGRQKSRPIQSIVAEARSLIDAGAMELVLVAQETTAYGKDLADGTHIADLCRALAGISETVWIRILYGHPSSIDERLIETVRETPNVLPYFDIPIQHASDRVLRQMGRDYGKADILRLVERIRNRIEHAVIRTTVITGFPGENRTDFAMLKSLVKQVRFDHLGVFAYSDAEDIPAHGLPAPVPRRTALARKDRIMALQMDISQKRLEAYIGKRVEVLIENRLEDELWEGRTWFQAPEVDGGVIVTGTELAVGQRVWINVRDSLEYDLMGEVLA